MLYSNSSTNMSQTETLPQCSSLVNYHPIHYPSEVKNESQRKDFKQKLLEGKPETLFADLYKNGDVSNIIFYTGHPSAWHRAIVLHHPSAERKGICNGWKLQLKESEDPDTVITTINIYKTGKIMVQGNLKNFQLDFQTLKTLAGAQKEKSGPVVTLPMDPPQTTSAPPPPPHNSLAEEEQNGMERELTSNIHPLISTTMNEMRDKLAHMESELVQLQETSLQTDSLRESNKAIHQQLSTMKTQYEDTQTQLKELQHDRDTCRKELAILTELLREMQQERNDSKKEIYSLAEKLREREVTINSLNEQLQLPTNPNHPEPQIPTSPLAASPDLQQPPEVQTNPSLPYEHPAEQLLAPIVQHTSDIIFLMDSNGKFLDEKRLFPNHSVTKIRCATTNRALDLLSEEHLGSPSHIIIHTGTNDLRTQQERVATSLRAVINKASNTFPNTKIVMSTLLPRKDFHPKTILGINASMSRDCALRPNVYLAHHPTLNMDNLYDSVHLKKENISTFARTLKDTALGRIPSSNHQNNRGEDRTQAAPTGTQGPAHRRRERRAPPHQHPQHRPSQHPGHGTTRESPEHRQGTPEHLPPLHPRPSPPPNPRLPPPCSPHNGPPRPYPPHLGPPPPPRSTTMNTTGPPQPWQQDLRSAPPSQLHRPQLHERSYAEALTGAPGSRDMMDIKQMLTLICTRLTGQGPW